MSKWIKKDKAELFIKKKQEEAANPPDNVGGGYALKWPNPKMGTETNPKEYRIRFLPDKNGDFYKEYFYHFITTGEGQGKYVFCPKSHGMEQYCPYCSAVQILYKGNKEDKAKAFNLKRKGKYVGNIYVVHDPRDADIKEEDWKQTGKVRLYEFPGIVESKIKDELTDPNEGYGIAIFDPENGFDLLLKVGAKPKDKNGKVWPDYSNTKFVRTSSPVSDDVDATMGEVYDLNEYLEKMLMSPDEHRKILKEALIYEDVEDEFESRMGNRKLKPKQEKEAPKKEEPSAYEQMGEMPGEKPKTEPEDPPFETEDDEDIMNELAGMMD